MIPAAGTEERFTEADAGRWRTLEVTAPGGSDQVERLLTALRPWLTGTPILVRPPWSAALGKPAQVKVQLPEHADLDGTRVCIETFLRDDEGGTVVERAFKPMLERFGGPHGMAVSMAHFVAASRISLEIIEATPARAERLRAVSVLLLASARASGAGVAAEIDWLRRYALAQQGLTGEPAPQVGRAAYVTASAAIARDGRDHVLATLGGDVDDWQEVQSGTWAALTRLRSAGRLSVEPEVVFATLVQMSHNRLGLLPEDNAYLAWLVALALA
ncbi:thiopeptide-type bacteriocin biosynthesis protein [Amycolatopsis sp. H20-H5]|uniref:thiopeptide-type bacteriocin biosynthesis protein n=1 Tax=Amycolatopsis sp. H20-H5 TaxID=3046309 RepID=UPI002DB877A9|nr:thiopeptide-type bacteriocin biosynthesis protein [Amycolatopsis sp. H20-H5]MEC3976883.1 thiopeptide-type bacteriocin biosynthesis protein [Amycolatopsis sp. H20-H5]